jgi:hypothetical protein
MSKKIKNTFTATQYNEQTKWCGICEMKKLHPCLFQDVARNCPYLKHKMKKGNE